MHIEEIFEEIERVISEIDKLKEKMYQDGISGRRFRLSVVGPFIDLYGKLVALSAYTPNPLSFPSDIEDTEESILRLLSRVNSFRLTYRTYFKNHELSLIQSDSLVELEKDDIDKIQEMINSAREIISKSQFLNDNHKQRLLSRLEILQSEIHKTRSDVDRALAGLVEAGDALGQFGKKARPFVKLFEDIANVFNSRRSEPLQLPSPPKQLPAPDGDDEPTSRDDH